MPARRTRKAEAPADEADEAGLTDEMRSICAEHGLPLSPALAKKFRMFYRDVVARLDYQSPHITGMYMRAMIYRYTGAARPKRAFLAGFSGAVFDRAIRRVREWLERDAQPAAAGAAPETVCNLYSMLR